MLSNAINPSRFFAKIQDVFASRAHTPSSVSYPVSTEDLVWSMGSFAALNRQPFDPALLVSQIPPPYTTDSLIHAARALGFKIKRHEVSDDEVQNLQLPCLVLLGSSNETRSPAQAENDPVRPTIVVKIDAAQVILFEAGSNSAVTLTIEQFRNRFSGAAFLIRLNDVPIDDPDRSSGNPAAFGFSWFIRELVRHKKVWRDVLIASLIIQLLALGTPLFTQVVIDKVVVQRTESTLLVIAVGLAVFMLFSALLTWVRQYLVLHTGNRVDAVLGAAVFEHVFKLPPRYFEHRPTGVIAARLRGVENIREFIASAAVTLILDLPFLLIFVAIMFIYSVTLTLIALSLISVIAIMSIIVAPIFRERLNEQFLLGARNQAFATEFIAGLETVKSLQMEPQVNAKYADYLAEYMRCGFTVKQIGNTYNVIANGIEQLMTLLILVVGAYTVIHDPRFSVGMLVAFQMFASRVSQPMLRMVGLWQQFQQANLSVLRLGDIMNAPTEPYSIIPSRVRQGEGKLEVADLSFRYADNLPFLYEGFAFSAQRGKVIAIMGPSGSGKSTLAKLLQGFYQPNTGTIYLDGNDIRYLSANELRSYFGVVPQETVLFSGTLYSNLLMANPHASFPDVVRACKMAEIHDAIEALPLGYQTEIGERGIGLSGGQKQRIAIARALLKKPKILIFDEATSSLDSQTAEHFATTVNQLRSTVTMLFITHNIPRTLQVDEIVRIGGGSQVSLLGLAPNAVMQEEEPNAKSPRIQV